MYDRILVPTDGSDVAAVAGEAAAALARRFGADLHVVHVRQPSELPPGIDDDAAADLARFGERATASIAETAAADGVAVTTAVVEDVESVHDAILGYAAEHDVDCIVMGTYGRTGVDRFVLGSVAEQTVREAGVPVMTVHGDTAVDPGFESVLVPTDGSSHAEAAADHAIDFALSTGGGVHVVHVVDRGVVRGDVGDGAILESLEAAGQRALDRIVGRAEAADLSSVQASVLTGPPARAIVDYAADQDVDCVVLGTHGRTGVDRYLLGSVAERVVRLSDVPVLTLTERAGRDRSA